MTKAKAVKLGDLLLEFMREKKLAPSTTLSKIAELIRIERAGCNKCKLEENFGRCDNKQCTNYEAQN